MEIKEISVGGYVLKPIKVTYELVKEILPEELKAQSRSGLLIIHDLEHNNIKLAKKPYFKCLPVEALGVLSKLGNYIRKVYAKKDKV